MMINKNIFIKINFIYLINNLSSTIYLSKLKIIYYK